MSEENDQMFRVLGLVGKHSKKLLDNYSIKKGVPFTRLIGIAIANELEKDKPFEYDVSPPEGEYIELAFVEEASKIMNYMSRSSGMSLELMCMVRHDMGLPDKKLFMLAFRECLLRGLIESYTPKKSRLSKFEYSDDYVFYRTKGASTKKQKEVRKKASEYETFQKLKRKFKDE